VLFSTQNFSYRIFLANIKKYNVQYENQGQSVKAFTVRSSDAGSISARANSFMFEQSMECLWNIWNQLNLM